MTVVIGKVQILADAMTAVFGTPYPVAVADTDDSNDAAAGRWRSPARARMVQSAATLIREHGIHGKSRGRVARRRPPRLARPLLSGRQDPAGDRGDGFALVDLFGDLEQKLGEAETFPEAVSVIVAPWRRLLVEHDSPWAAPWRRPFATRPPTTASAPMSARGSRGGGYSVVDAYAGSGRRGRKPAHTRPC